MISVLRLETMYVNLTASYDWSSYYLIKFSNIFIVVVMVRCHFLFHFSYALSFNSVFCVNVLVNKIAWQSYKM